MLLNELTEKIINYCKENNIKKVYICGNGGSGKTTLSKKIANTASKYGHINLISTDDFMVDTELRKNSKVKWFEKEKEYCNRYTSSNKESYFFKNIYEILYNLGHGLDCYYFQKKYAENNSVIKLYSNSFLTIIEGVGTAFMNITKEKTLSIFLKCDENEERERRKSRTISENRNKIELYDENRSSQYRVNVLSKQNGFDIIINSEKDFTFTIIKNNKNFNI